MQLATEYSLHIHDHRFSSLLNVLRKRTQVQLVTEYHLHIYNNRFSMLLNVFKKRQMKVASQGVPGAAWLFPQPQEKRKLEAGSWNALESKNC